MAERLHFVHAGGALELRLDERQLLLNAQPAALGGRAFDLLVALAQRRDRVVNKSELLDLVWPGLVVEENNLQAQVSALRKLLGAPAIATLPGRGYRFTLTQAPSPAATPGPGATPAAAPQPAPTGARLLVADDNKVNRLLLVRSLVLQGHAVDSVDNGRDALERLRSQPYALLLLDLEMPGLDGFALLAHVRDEPALRDLPVIVTSSVEGVDSVARCIELGAEDFLHKPIDAVLLKARVGMLLQKKRLRDEQQALLARLQAGHASAGLHREGAHLTATVLVARLAYADTLAAWPPAALLELLGAWATLMADTVDAHAGVLLTLAGDRLLAVFGADQAEPDGQHGGAAAMQAAQDMAALSRQLDQEHGGQGQLATAIGMARGPVLLGLAGTPQRPAQVCAGIAADLARQLAAAPVAPGSAAAIRVEPALLQTLPAALRVPPVEAGAA